MSSPCPAHVQPMWTLFLDPGPARSDNGGRWEPALRERSGARRAVRTRSCRRHPGRVCSECSSCDARSVSTSRPARSTLLLARADCVVEGGGEVGAAVGARAASHLRHGDGDDRSRRERIFVSRASGRRHSPARRRADRSLARGRASARRDGPARAVADRRCTQRTPSRSPSSTRRARTARGS